MTVTILKAISVDKNLFFDFNYILNNNHQIGDFVLNRKDSVLMKVKKKDEKEISFTKASVIEFPEEKKFSFDSEFNVIVNNKKYLVKEKINPTQVLKIDNYYYIIEETIKHGKSHKEYVVKRIETKPISIVYPVKKTYLDKRNKIGAFEFEYIELHLEELDAMISLSHRQTNNDDKKICYSL